MSSDEAQKKYQQLNKNEEALRQKNKPEPYLGSQYAEQQLNQATSQSTGVSFTTSYGSAKITHSGTGQVMVSSKQSDFGGSYNNKFMDYKHWAAELDKTPNRRVQFATDMLACMKDNTHAPDLTIYTSEQKRAATMLITTTSTSEEFRVDGSRKLARAALKAIINHGKTFTEAFGAQGFFPMTGTGGTSYTRSLMTEPTHKPTTDEILLASCMSPLREPDSDSDSD